MSTTRTVLTFGQIAESSVIATLGQVAKKYPSRTLLTCGLLMSALPVGFGMNAKLLDEHDLLPDQIRSIFPVIGILMAVVALAGFVLIGLSVLVAVRRWSNKTMANPISSDRIAQDSDDSE